MLRTWGALLITAFAGCSSDPAAVGTDAAVTADAARADAGRGDAAAGGDDARAEDDAGPSLDAAAPADAGTGPDPSLAGTRFARVVVRWSAPLELCTQFRQRSLDDARAARLHLTLLPAPRPGLGRAALAASTLAGGTLRTSPLAADQRAIGAVTSTLTAWTLDDPSGQARLFAELAHPVEGGRIVETISAARDGTTDDPVDVDALREVSFRFEATGGARTIPLERCGVGAPELTDALEVLAAEGPGGETLAVLRQIRSRTVFAGSAPVTLLGGRLARSSAPGQRWSARGFWAWTYAASLHNWNEQSVLDFTRDPGLWHTEFAPGLAGPVLPTAVAQVELVGVNSPGGPGALVLHEQTVATGRVRRTDWAVIGSWKSADPSALTVSCAGGRVDSVLVSEDVFAHVARCPDGTIEALLPVLFAYDHRRDGEVLGARDLTPTTVEGRRGVRAAFGRAALDVAPWDGADYVVRVLDAAGAEALTGIASPWSGPWDRPDEVLERVDAGGRLRLTLVRRWTWQGVGESALYAPISATLEVDGVRHHAEALDRLRYTNTHHNWDDALVATTDTHEVRWQVSFGAGGLTETVALVRRSDGAVVVPETVVGAP